MIRRHPKTSLTPTGSVERTYWFGGGLGDVILALYGHTGFEDLLKESEAWVVHAFGNPHVTELFRWLPNAPGIRMIDVDPKRLEWMAAGYKGSRARELVAWAGRNPDTIYLGNPRPNWDWDHCWQAPDLWFPADKYAVIQPFAGDNSRDIPVAVLSQLCESLLDAGLQPVMVTRDFIRVRGGIMLHNEERLPRGLRRFHAGNLSIPATLSLTARASGVVAPHSSLLHAGVCQRRPTLVLRTASVMATRFPKEYGGERSWYFYYEDQPHVTSLSLTSPYIGDQMAAWVSSIGVL